MAKAFLPFIFISMAGMASPANCQPCSRPNQLSVFARSIGEFLIQKSHGTCPLIYHETSLALPWTRAIEGDTSPLGGTRSYYGIVSPFWAQEMVGSDLAFEFMQTQPYEKVNFGMLDRDIVLTSIPDESLARSMQKCKQSRTCRLEAREYGYESLDTIFPEHGTRTLNLIVGPAPIGGSPAAKLSRANTESTVGAFPKIAREFSEGHDKPILVSASVDIGEFGCTADGSKGLQELAKNTVFVMSAGNRYPAPIKKCGAEESSIIVGSVEPNGMPSPDSQEGAPVTILAPGGYETMSVNSKGFGALHGQTSAAAPQTSSALLNILGSDKNMTSASLRKLLVATATPTLISTSRPGTNGAGLLNSYRLIRLFTLLNGEITDSAIAEANQKLKKESGVLFEEAKDNLLSNNCTTRRMGFRKLRQAFFLNPTEPTVRKRLADAYTQEGYLAESQFYEQSAPDQIFSSIHNPKFRCRLKSRYIGTRCGE